MHFAANRLVEPRRNQKATEMQVLRAVKEWKMKRKQPLKDGDIARMIRNLNAHGWIDLEPSPKLPLPEDVFVDEFELIEA